MAANATPITLRKLLEVAEIPIITDDDFQEMDWYKITDRFGDDTTMDTPLNGNPDLMFMIIYSMIDINSELHLEGNKEEYSEKIIPFLRKKNLYDNYDLFVQQQSQQIRNHMKNASRYFNDYDPSESGAASSSANGGRRTSKRTKHAKRTKRSKCAKRSRRGKSRKHY